MVPASLSPLHHAMCAPRAAALRAHDHAATRRSGRVGVQRELVRALLVRAREALRAAPITAAGGPGVSGAPSQ